MKTRASGILLHITSLPSPWGIGDIGPPAYRFVDFLHESGQSFWQILPINPVPGFANSPYQVISAFAGNPLLISPEILEEEGLLETSEMKAFGRLPAERIDYGMVRFHKETLLGKAWERFKNNTHHPDFQEFCRSQSSWLEDYSLFVVLEAHFRGRPWNEWPEAFRNRQPDALNWAKEEMQEDIEKENFLQYMFFSQWTKLKAYCFQKGIQLIGDLPIYMHHNSADVWACREIFKLDGGGNPTVVSGVPPDYFSETGQLWGNPVYRWNVLKERGYNWWVQRIQHNLVLTDLLRVDHFRGLVAYWEVPCTETTAINGYWVKAPVMDFFKTLLKRFPFLPIIAEDLGTITPDVREVIHHFDLPGMKVLLFAFGDDLATNPYVPHNVVRNSVVYTGTHDNNTVRGWFEKEASREVKERLFTYLGRELAVEEVNWEFIRLAMMSVADICIIPMQDVLGLGEEARMNRPSSGNGNWEWRLLQEQVTPETAEKLRMMSVNYGRV